MRVQGCMRTAGSVAAWLSLLGAGPAFMALAASPAAAQEAPPVVADDATSPCRVAAIDGGERRPRELRASCREYGLMLGPVSEYQVIASESLEATLVDARLGGDRRVLLLSIQMDGQPPLIEDLTGQIARAAGRGPMSAIDGVELDFKSFAQAGTIGVRGRPEDVGEARADTINLSEQIARERSRRVGTGRN